MAGADTMRRLLRIAISAALLGGFSLAAWAHGGAEWIMNDPKTNHCCGPKDCAPLERGSVIVTQGGYMIIPRQELIPFGHKELYTSADDRFWLCVHLEEDGAAWPNGPTRCFFAPATGV